MTTLNATQIDKHDLVLVEANLTRWKTAKDKKTRRGWSLWDVGFELQAVSLLFAAPAGTADEDTAPNANFDDDM